MKILPDPIDRPDYTRLGVLLGMNSLSNVYAGTVPAATVARRRAANKVARASRRANRRSAR